MGRDRRKPPFRADRAGMKRALPIVGLGFLALLPLTFAAQAADKVSLRFGFVATGIDAPWTYGIEKGFFRDNGIELELREGKGSAVTAQTVAAGTDDFGVDVDGGTFLNLAAKGLPATAVLANAGKSPLVVFSAADKPLKTPADLVGARISITAGDGPSALLPVLLKRNGIDASKVTQINMQPGPKLVSLLTGRVDGMATNYALKATLESKGLKVHSLMYADFGVVTPGMYMIVSNSLLNSKPDLVQRFVGAAQKSLLATAENPQAAAESFSRMYPSYDRQGAAGETLLLLQLLHSEDTKGKPAGTVSLADAKAGADVLIASGLMEPGADVTKFVTNRFIEARKK
ncbi:NitT/TauT family transport system substrate-binding protein [Beijerinckia sp. GAS462]|nr:NitT/TauT family transport system substrate-binding protein [Beijerinckia sp. GAS462]SEC66238.1 NitT/TauT family transport system substrate-binding protein [Beijerinckia sp. 28-YEA-48]